MKLIVSLAVWTLVVNIISGLPVHQRTGRLGHVIHYHKDGPAGRLRKHLHPHANRTATPQPARQSASLHGHAINTAPHSNNPSGHAHELPRESALRGTGRSNLVGRRHNPRYDVPSHGHFASNSNNKNSHSSHSHSSHGAHGHADHTHSELKTSSAAQSLDFDLSSLAIEKDLFKDFPSSPSTQAPTRRHTIAPTTPVPKQWKIKNTVQVSDMRSFDTMFRQAVNGRKQSTIAKPPPDTPQQSGGSMNANNTPVVRYSDISDPTLPSKLINKRGIGRLGNNLPRMAAQRDTRVFNNKLTIRVWNEANKRNGVRSNTNEAINRRDFIARATATVKPVTSAPKFTRLGRLITRQTRPAATVATTAPPYRPPVTPVVEYTLKTNGTTRKPEVKSADMVKLEGIHVMFSDGKQQKNSNVPTLHLTASIGDKANTQTPKPMQPKNQSQNMTLVNSLQTIINKIVGTAIIKNGHLYLVVYPFGQNKSVDLRYPKDGTFRIPAAVTATQNPNKTQLPTNRPVPIPGMGGQSSRMSSWRGSSPSTSKPDPTTTAATPAPLLTTTMSAMMMEHLLHGHMHGMDHSMDHDMHAATTKDPSHDPLAPIPRFMSPWQGETVNLSSVFPYPTNLSQIDDDDKDIKVVPFVAQANDPFEKIKMIIAALAKTTANATDANQNNSTIDPSADASFNFELKIKGNLLATTKDPKHETTTATDNSSDERTTFYNPTNDAVKDTVTMSSVTDYSHHTEGNNKYMASIRTKQPTEQASGVEQTATTLQLTPTVSTASNKRPSIKPTFASNAEQGTSTQKEVSSKKHFGRINDGRQLVGGQVLSPDVNPSTATLTQRFGKTNSQTVKQLHASENLVLTKSMFRHTALPRRTSEAPLVATPQPTFQVSSEQQVRFLTNAPSQTITRATLSPRPPGRQTNMGHPETNHASQQGHVVAKPQNNAPEQSNRFRQTVVAPIRTGQQQMDPQDRARPVNQLNRGQSEQIISLADVLTDIRKIQLHNMQKFNINNNNFNTMLNSNADRAPPLRSQVFNNYHRIPSSRAASLMTLGTTRPTDTKVWQPRPINRQQAMRDALDAMLVLSVDDIMADHASLHGALVLSQPRDSSSGSSSSNK